MPTVLIIHDVADYEAWKTIFDAAADIRREAGEREYRVLRAESDPNRIVHLSEWTSTTAARAFFQSPRLVRIRKEAGVHEPQFLYLEESESGTL